MPTDNVVANAGSGGDTFRTLAEAGGVEWPASVLGYATTISAGANVVQLVDATHGLPVAVVGTVTVGSHAVTNAGTFAVQVDGNALTSLQLIDNLVLLEDAAHVSGDPGVQLLTVRKDTAAATGGTDGDYQPLVTDSTGRLHVNVGNTVTVTGSGTFTVSGAVTQSGTWTVQPGNTANTTAWLVTGTGGTFPATQSGTWSVRNQDGSGNALTSATRGSERALSVQIVDASGAQIASFGGGTQYTEADTDSTITGTAMMWEDTSDTLRAVSAAKPLPVAIISGAGSGGTAMADDAAFTVATTSITPVGGTYKSTLDSVDDGDAGAFHMTIKRALHVNVRDSSGNEVIAGPVSSWSHLRKDVTGTAAALGSSTSASIGVTVKANDANTAAVYIGSSTSVTAGGTAATDGFEMNAGDVAFFPVNNLNLLFGISASGTQKVSVTVH